MTEAPLDAVHEATFSQLTVDELYAILRLRSDVFVVEQRCVYLDPDGRDTEPDCLHLWVERAGATIGYLRVLDDRTARRIGRVVTNHQARGSGIAAQLVQHALDTTDGPWVLDAQSHLATWYERLGFVAAGAEFVEDGIPHLPMHRPVRE